MAVDEQQFKRALGSWASGVTILTTLDSQGQPRGMTASAFSSLSLRPPLVLTCVDHRAVIHDSLTVGKAMAVHILAEGQEELSQRFAVRESERFVGLEYATGLDGVPLLPDYLARLECRIVYAHPGGDHTIVCAEVEHVDVRDLNPLLHFRGKYRLLRDLNT